MKKTKIIIAGIGGVGGYFGGLLAKHYYNHEDIRVYFVARGPHLHKIQQNGLTVISRNGTFIAHPVLATDNPGEIGVADFIIACTKTYDLETTIQQLAPCIGPHTILLPLLNGAGNKEKIEALLPGNLVAGGCVYIVSRLKENGVIENSGNIQQLYFGLDNGENDRLQQLESIFKEAGIEAELSARISEIVWEKFIFISPTATATSYFDKTIGEILANPEYLATLTGLIEEVKLVAGAKQIPVPEGITEKVLNRLQALPFETTSSMHSDFKNNKPYTELSSLTGYVLQEAEKYGLTLPVYQKLYEGLNTR